VPEGEPLAARVGFRLRIDSPGAGGTDPAGSDDAPALEGREALRLLQSASRSAPEDPDYYHILGDALLRAGRPREALGPCREAVERDPVRSDYRFALGCAAWLSERFEEAEAAFRDVVHLRPGDAASLAALGATLVRLERDEEALAPLAQALRAEPQRAEAHASRGIALLRTGRVEEGLAALRRSVQIRPDEPDFRRDLGLALAALRRHGEAVDVLRRVAERWPQRVEAHLDLAEALDDAGRVAESARALAAAERLDPTILARRPRSRRIRDAARAREIREEVARERTSPGVGRRLVGMGLGLLEAVFAWGGRHIRLSGPILALALAVFAWGTWRLAPPYFARYLMEDDIVVVARAPVRDDAVVQDRLAHAVHRRGLDERLGPGSCRIETEPGWRRISCHYEVPVEVLPRVWRTLRFDIDVEQPYLVEPEPLLF
jgi:tetratricopeptide (TPR) repeat protein